MQAGRFNAVARRLWVEWQSPAIIAAVLGMSVAATLIVGYSMWRLVFDTSETAAFDLGLRLEVVQAFFARDPVYEEIDHAVYPPASQLLLWPFVGWLEFTQARWLWAATSLASLVWLSKILLRELEPRGFWPRSVVALLPLAFYPTGATIGNGQLAVHLLPPLLAGCLRLTRSAPGWRRDLAVAGLVLLALTKPSVTAPFFWIVVFVPGSLRPAALCVAAYAGLTLVAALLHGREPVALLSAWFEAARWGVHHGTTRAVAHLSLPELLSSVIRPASSAPFSLALLALLGGWVWWMRARDIWTLLGVSALVARFWTHHRWYDDLLLLIPLVAVLGIARREFTTTGRGVAAGLLFAFNLVPMAVPGGRHLFRDFGLEMTESLYLAAQIVGWCGLLIFLLVARRAAPPGEPEGGSAR